MSDISKPSPAREHFVGLGNGLEKNCNINAYFPLIGKQTNDFLDVKFKTSPIRVPLSFENRTTRLLSLCLFNFLIPLFILKRLILNKSDIIYSRHMPADLVNLLLAKIFNVKYCVEINGDVRADRNIVKKNNFITKVLATLQKFVIINSTYIVVPTANLKRNIVHEYDVKDDKIIYIENGVEISKFERISNSHNLPTELNDKFIFGYAGVFSEWQGIHLIVEALNYLNESVLSQSAFVLAGDGPELPKIKSLIKKLKLEKYFYFTGFLQQDKYISVVKKFDICLAPYIKERNDYWGVSPIKIHSYMACSKPIIASNISGARQLITEAKCGYLFEPDNAESLAYYMSKSFESRTYLELLGKSGFESVSLNCTWDKLAEKLYERIKK